MAKDDPNRGQEGSINSLGIKALLLDMDGLLYHGDQPLAGARVFLQKLRHFPHLFITNNPILPPQAIAAKLERIGLPRPDPARIITSAGATAQLLARQRTGFRYFAVGAEGLHSALEAVGTADAYAADFVVVGEGAGLDYYSLTRGINLILKRGAKLVVTNPDQTVDANLGGEHLLLPGGGALVAAFEVATGHKALVVGKPEPLLYQCALDQLGVKAAACLMIGDRPDTDLLGAARLGMRTALVRSGRFRPEDPWPPEVPPADYDVADLDELRHRLGGLLVQPGPSRRGRHPA